jgi:hypothetical protein
MAKGISVHVGINRVDPAHYQGWDGALVACEFDAKDMRALAKKKKFGSTKLLLTKKATAQAVTDAIRRAAKTLKKGDLFFLTYSGHGGQVRDTNGDEADPGRMDETWVCYDRQLVDDEVYELWGEFRPGVRIVVLSDSCHSGTVTRAVPPFLGRGPRPRAMPRAVGARVERTHAKLYRGIQQAHPAAEKTKVRATVLLISGCMDNQFSLDGDRNGLFTATLKRVWNSGKFPNNYRKFRDKIVARMPKDQTPNYFVVGAASPAFEKQKPFTI